VKTSEIMPDTSVGFVILIYFTIAIVAVGNLPCEQIILAEEYALAAVAKSFLGNAGFTLIGVLSCISALIVLVAQTASTLDKLGLFVVMIIVSFAIEYIYRKISKRENTRKLGLKIKI